MKRPSVIDPGERERATRIVLYLLWIGRPDLASAQIIRVPAVAETDSFPFCVEIERRTTTGSNRCALHQIVGSAVWPARVFDAAFATPATFTGALPTHRPASMLVAEIVEWHDDALIV